MQINMLEAKTNLSKLVRQLENKDVSEVVLARGGKPVAVIVPYKKSKTTSRLGIAKKKCPELYKNKKYLSFESLTSGDGDIAAAFNSSIDSELVKL